MFANGLAARNSVISNNFPFFPVLCDINRERHMALGEGEGKLLSIKGLALLGS